MARVIISEYRAKKILLGDSYEGIATTLDSCQDDVATLDDKKTYTVKVDQGEKKRFKRGLIALDVDHKNICKELKKIADQGFTNFLVEPYSVHDEKAEHYFSLERERDGWRVLYVSEGGVNVESGSGAESFLIAYDALEKDIAQVAQACKIPESFLSNIITVAEEQYLNFIEINPLVCDGEEVLILDAAVRVDSEAAFFVRGGWQESDFVAKSDQHAAEQHVAALDRATPAALKLSVLNPEGNIFFLLSSGGASIVNADYAFQNGCADNIANYGEYSGAPTREETYLYAVEVLQLLINSQQKKKVLVISGGVANFTDVLQTFLGIIDALEEYRERLQEQNIKVFVRRGGPREREGLAQMEKFLTKHDLCGAVYGSDVGLERAVEEAISEL